MSSDVGRPLRVLDGGCHDGFVGAWLQERYEGEIELYGIELMPEAAQRARERGYKEVVVGKAEDCFMHFEPGTFDLALAFEVIEHVPDVAKLLSALEAMVTIDGRVMVSTPDGTFGTGNNPHHLRALRSIDLADTLRRRGTLHDMTVGVDGVTVASYSPRERLGDVAIFTGPSWMTWSPIDIERKGLGGSETAAVRLGEQLSELGYVVTVYGECEQGMYRDVAFRDWRTFDPLEPRQAVIASRLPELFDRPVAARKRLLWLHDVDVGPRLTGRRADRIDHVLTLSRWHEDHVQRTYPFLNGKLERTRNGIARELFETPYERTILDEPGLQAHHPLTERASRVLYTSSPDRGLDILLELWPRVREQVPDAELHYAYADVYQRIAEQDPVVGEHAEKVRQLADQPGVVALGSLSQPDLARLMRSSLVWCAPSYNTPHDQPFCETSCIGAMEAQAAGLCVVASGWGALRETVKVGALVDGPVSERWRDAFVAEIVRGLTDPDVQAHAQEKGPEAVKDMGWDGVAQQVAGLVEDDDADRSA